MSIISKQFYPIGSSEFVTRKNLFKTVKILTVVFSVTVGPDFREIL